MNPPLHRAVKLLLPCFLLFGGKLAAQTDTTGSPKMILQGNYEGKNLFVQNPYAPDGQCCCMTQVRVNQRVIATDLGKSVCVIPLDSLGLKKGDSLYVEIFHRNTCMPKALYTDRHRKESSFELLRFTADTSGLLQWTCKNEKGTNNYSVEVFRWNRWVNLGEVKGKEPADSNSYSFRTVLNSGSNLFRLKQVVDGVPCLSKTVPVDNPVKEVRILNRDGLRIYFSTVTMYEVYDRYGTRFLSGTGDHIDIHELVPGRYFLNFDNSTGEFKKK